MAPQAAGSSVKVRELLMSPPTKMDGKQLKGLRKNLKQAQHESQRSCVCAPFTGIMNLISGGRNKRSDPTYGVKLDLIAAKIDRIADKIKVESDDEADVQEAQVVLAEAEKLGIEVARYSEIPQLDASILDTYIPRYRRMTQLHFGHIVSNPHAPMAFREKMGYNMTFNLVPPGNGNALHMHKSIEIFVALDGRWRIAWGMQGQHGVTLNPWDFVVVPARVCHSYQNIETDTANNIMTILPGKSWIAWAPEVVEEARSHGADCDDNGVLKKFANTISRTSAATLAASAGKVDWLHMGPDDMAPYLHRFSEKKPYECQMSEAGPDGTASTIEMFWKTIEPDGVCVLPARNGIDLLLVVLDGNVIVKSSNGTPITAAGRLDSIRVPTEALDAGKVIVSNPLPSKCVLLITATEMRHQNDLYFHLC